MTIKIFSKVTSAFTLTDVKRFFLDGMFYEIEFNDGTESLRLYRYWTIRIEVLEQ